MAPKTVSWAFQCNPLKPETRLFSTFFHLIVFSALSGFLIEDSQIPSNFLCQFALLIYASSLRQYKTGNISIIKSDSIRALGLDRLSSNKNPFEVAIAKQSNLINARIENDRVRLTSIKICLSCSI